MKAHVDLTPVWLEEHREEPFSEAHGDGIRLYPPSGRHIFNWLRRELCKFDAFHLHGVFGWARYASGLGGTKIASFRGSDLNLGIFRQPTNLNRIVKNTAVCTYMNPVQQQLATRLFRPAGEQMIVPNHKTVTDVEAAQLELPRPIICCVNEFRRVTGLDFLLQAFRKLNTGTLLLVGPFHPVDAPYYEQILFRVPRVHRTGAVAPSRVLELLKASDVAVFPSVSEGMPNKVLEAMSVGVPVIGSDVPGIRYVLEDGIHGRLFRSRDHEDLLRVLTEVLHSPMAQQKAWTTAALAKIRTDHSQQRELEGWLKCYRAAGLTL
jgi:glycosyltransferase involved in cell wall biosynthesis